MICDLRESEDQIIVRCLGGFNESVQNVVELQTYSTLDEVSILEHNVELQRKAKLKKEALKPAQTTYPFQEGVPPVATKPLSTPTGPSTLKLSIPIPPLNP